MVDLGEKESAKMNVLRKRYILDVAVHSVQDDCFSEISSIFQLSDDH